MSVDPGAVIRSRSNANLKRVAAALAGKRPGDLVLEGDRLVADALGAGLRLQTVLVADDRPDKAAELDGRAEQVLVVERALLDRISPLKTSPGLIAVCPVPAEVELDGLDIGAETLLLVVAGVADPGNLGALARSAEAAGARGIAVVRGGASPWNDKALRGSMGSLLRLPVVRASSAEQLAEGLGERGVRQCIAATRGGASFRDFDWSGPLALWVGSETGEAPEVCGSMEGVTIPMAGEVESLNVAVATSVLLFAAGRSLGGGS